MTPHCTVHQGHFIMFTSVKDRVLVFDLEGNKKDEAKTLQEAMMSAKAMHQAKVAQEAMQRSSDSEDELDRLAEEKAQVDNQAGNENTTEESVTN